MSEKPTISQEDVLVRAQNTPNPNALKFVISHPAKNEGKATFQSISECENIPLAKSLFDIPGVKQVYFFENTITVTHSGELPSDIVKDNVTSVIKSRLPIHNPDFSVEEEERKRKQKERSEQPEEVQAMEEILDRTVRPGLQADGGGIEIVEYDKETREVKILYQGACGGCPSAMMGTLEAIENILRHEMDQEDLQVVPV